MTWQAMADRINRMTAEEKRRTVYVERDNGSIHGVTIGEFETDCAVTYELAEGYPVLKPQAN